MSKRKKRIIAFTAAVILIAAAAIIWIAWENSNLTVSEITIESVDIPKSFSGYRIAQVSDLHNAEFGRDNEQLISTLKETKPDVVFITGDLVDSRNTDIDIAVSFAEKSAEIAPTYYVTGNHEARIPDYGHLRDKLKASGVTVLENERTELTKNGGSITLIGIDDPNFSADFFYTGSVNKTLNELTDPKSAYTILLAHRPELFEDYVQSDIDLVFSGHAHGGQFRLPFIGGLVAPGQGLFPEYDSGLYTEGSANMVVSRGIGNSLFPFRVNNPPEIVLVKLQSLKE